MKLKVIIFLFFVLLFTNCEDNTIIKHIKQNKINSCNIKYAKGFKIEYFNNYKLITTYNPWNNNSVFYKYYIFNNNIDIKISNNEIILPTTKDSIIALSSSQIGFLNALELTNKIIGISKKEYIYNKSIIKKVEKNLIQELGDETNLNYENIFNTKPKIVFSTAWGTQNQSFNKISELRIPIIYLLEWQENTPLGRAEWIKFVAAFFNKETQADSIFNIIERNYNKLKQTKYKTSPSVLHGSLINGTWFVPGGESYIANLYKDAHSNYLWSTTKKRGSLALKFESIYKKAGNADFWFPIINIASTKELINIENRYSLFNPIKTKNIFLTNKRQNKYGGNDYWESGVANPDKVLNDLVNILHNDTIKNEDLIYFNRIR